MNTTTQSLLVLGLLLFGQQSFCMRIPGASLNKLKGEITQAIESDNYRRADDLYFVNKDRFSKSDQLELLKIIKSARVAKAQPHPLETAQANKNEQPTRIAKKSDKQEKEANA